MNDPQEIARGLSAGTVRALLYQSASSLALDEMKMFGLAIVERDSVSGSRVAAVLRGEG